jgi:hypothetical protein
MSSGFDFKKLRRLITIHMVVQVVLVLLLVLVALQFQGALGSLFWKSIIMTLIIQLIAFWPINFFATKEAKREVAATAVNISPEEFKSQRQKRLIGEVIKMSVFAFFLIFTYSAPKTDNMLANRFTQSLIFFNFILTYLSYFQCFNFAAKREMKANS